MPYLQAFDNDLCKLLDNSANPDPFTALLWEALRKIAPKLYHPCPYSGDFGVENISINDMIESSVPQVVPTGIYKMIWRFYSKRSNRTYIQIHGTAEVKAINVMHRIRM